MENIQLKQLIRESIQEYIREVEASGNIAAQEAKIKASEEAIALREKKANMEGLDEAYHDMMDQSKLGELKKEIKELQKYKAKAEKVLEKMKAKAEGKTMKKMEDESVEEKVIDEVNIDEYTTDPAAGPQLEELTPEESEELRKKAEANDKEYNIAEMLYMQKLAGIISETEYNEKLEEARFKKGTDIGKKGKGFAKIAKSAAERYGSKEAGEKVAGAILKKVLKKKK